MRDWKPCRKPLLLLHIIAVKCASGVCFFFLRDCFESWGDFISYGCVFNFLEFVFIFLKSCISVNSAIISISNLFKFLITPITSLHCPGPQKAALDGSKTVIFAVSSNHTETWWDWNSFKTWVHSSRFWVVASFFGWFYASSFVFFVFCSFTVYLPELFLCCRRWVKWWGRQQGLSKPWQTSESVWGQNVDAEPLDLQASQQNPQKHQSKKPESQKKPG